MMKCAMVRSKVALATLGFAVVAACSRDAAEPPQLEPPAAALAPGQHGLLVSVADPAQNPAAGVLVTVTNVASGEFLVGFTGPRGKADFKVNGGSYLVHARNLADAGPVLNPFPVPLVTAPLPDGAGLISTGATQGLNRLGVLYDPAAANTSVPLDPANYSRLTATPPLVFSGASTRQSIALQFATGGALDCTFLDGTGAPITLPTTENVFVILPHGTGPLPPIPSYAAGLTLPRGILLGVTTAPAGSSGCALQGLGGVAAVVETNTVANNTVFVGQAPAGGGQVQLVQEPRRSQIGYLLDPFGDNTGSEDIGLTTYGWTLGPVSITDDFVVSTRFRGAGDYLVQLNWTSPTPAEVVVRMHCDATGCVQTLVEPDNMAGSVSSLGTVFLNGDILTGNIQVTFTIPGVTNLTVQVLGGRPPRSDLAPDSGSQPVTKTGTGNTWLIPGD
jgi:hypothetical protein